MAKEKFDQKMHNREQYAFYMKQLEQQKKQDEG